MNAYTFTLIFDENNIRYQKDYTIDIGDWVEDDFLGNDGEEYLEKLLLQEYPNALLCWIECPDDLPV